MRTHARIVLGVRLSENRASPSLEEGRDRRVRRPRFSAISARIFLRRFLLPRAGSHPAPARSLARSFRCHTGHYLSTSYYRTRVLRASARICRHDRNSRVRALLGKLNIFLGRTRGEIHGAIPRDILHTIAIFQRNFIYELLRENYYTLFFEFLLIDGGSCESVVQAGNDRTKLVIQVCFPDCFVYIFFYNIKY